VLVQISLKLRLNPAELPYSSTAIEFLKADYLKNQHFAYAFREIMLSLRAFPHRLGLYPEMTLKSEDVRNIAHLARLQVTEDEIDRYVTELSSILALVDEMNQIDSKGVLPLANPMDATQRLRDDEVTEGNLRDKFQAIAPDVEGGLYRVPRVIE